MRRLDRTYRRRSYLLVAGFFIAMLLAISGAMLRAAPAPGGPGGPILVISSAANPFSQYYPEILRAEGLNAFSALDLTAVTAATLNNYDVVILGEMPITAAQTSMFANWVANGGNLIAMKPDKQLSPLLGLVDASASLADGYVLVDTSAAPGKGIVGQTMQFHGTADRYTIADATSIATLYATASAGTVNPAVTVRSVGGAGGQAAAFTYDLARSVVYTRQGNPAWSGQERDGASPIRSDDLFFGGSQPNYVDLSKVAIPQADEQQRLLANLIAFMNADRKPMPKFWYFPRGVKAAVVMTGDDHGNNGTAGRFDIYNGNSPSGCVLANWECVRATSYIYPNTPISNAAAAGYVAQGFEIGTHISTGCGDYTPASLEQNYAGDLASWAALFPSLPAPRTNRTHCIAWSDYDTQPQVALAHGIRFDTNYYYWPDTWVNNVPGVFTGSGMPMRFAKADGTMLDVYQGATQMTDESGQTFPLTIDALLDRALGATGYFGAFVANMHTDTAVHAGSQAIVASAQARHVPIVSAKQMLDWVDGRNGSTFTNIAWNGSDLTFIVTPGSGANGLQTMVPANVGGATVSGLTRSGTPVSYTVDVIKGVGYAMFTSVAGSYDVQYSADTTPPVISAVGATADFTSATVTWTTDESATSGVDYGTTPGALTLNAAAGMGTSHAVPLTGLTPGATYYYRVTSVDVTGLNSATSPAPPAAPATFSAGATQCPCSIWPSTQMPTQASAVDPSPIEVGVKFRSAIDGLITGVRFYKGASNTGVHIGSLWSLAGTKLGTVTFSGETATGWQEATFPAPVAVTANTTYVISYHSNAGNYAVDQSYFQTAGVTRGPLQALATGVDGGNGVYAYGAGAFPSNTYSASNYWVDVVLNTAHDVTPPTVTATTPSAGSVGVSTSTVVTAVFSEDVDPSTVTPSTFELRNAANALVPATVAYASATRTATLTPTATLANAVVFTARVHGGGGGVADRSGNVLAADVTWSFTTANAQLLSLVDTTSAQFGAGTLDAGAYVSETANGEVILAPATGTEFSGSTLPAGWSSAAWNSGGAVTASGGQLVVDGARASLDAVRGPGQSLEFVATFSASAPYQHAGLGLTLNETPWIIFSTGSGGSLYARTNDGSSSIDTPISGSWLGTPHRFRIDWTASSVTFAIDGTTVVTRALAVATSLRPIVSDYNVGGGGVNVDWMRLTPYATSGLFTSRILDAGSTQTWGTLSWNAVVPPTTNLGLAVRFGDTPIPDASWTPFANVSSSGAVVSGASRFVQYQATLGGNGTATVELQDVTITAASGSAPPPSLSIADASAVEGNSGLTNMALVVSLSAPSAQVVSVNYATSAGTATSGVDFGAGSGTLTFQPGVTQQSVLVSVIGDTLVESDEMFAVTLSSPANATIARGQATATILNDDSAALPAISIGNASVTEGNTGSQNVTLTLTLTSASAQVVTVGYATADGTAVSGSDYTAKSGAVTFAAGTTSQTLTVAVLGDTLSEASETFFVNLSGPTNATLATAQGVVSIVDNDAVPSIRISDVTIAEGDSGVASATLNVTLSAASSQTVTVAFATADGTATAADYTPTSGTLTFAPGVTSQAVSVAVVGDLLDEANETVNVNLSGATNATIADALGVITITDNDPVPTISINDVSVNETDSGSSPAVLTVTLSAASGRTVTVNYTTANGTATAADYTSASGTLTFPAGVTSQTVSVNVTGDLLRETNETINVNLSGATNATIADTRGVITIVDNDPLPSITVDSPSTTEGLVLLTKNLTFTATLSAPSAQSVSFSYATANGTATAGSDYTAKSGTVTFSAGSTTQTFTVVIRGDIMVEPNETFFVNVSAPVNATLGTTSATGTILNDD